MKKTKCIKSLIGIGTIGAIGLGVSAGITSCGKATTTDVVSFNNDYLPSMTIGQEQTFHALSSIDGKISYTAANLPASGVDFNSTSGKLHYTTALPTNQDITINATSDKGGHSSIKITLLADTPTPTPALSASILDNNLQLGTTRTATLSVTEINASTWTDSTLTVPTGLTASGSWTDTTDPLTKTATISLSSGSSPTVGSHTITISASGYTDITQTITVLPEIALVISPTTLANDQTLFADCNLVIDSSGVLNKKAAWDSSTNTTFTTYLTNRHITTNITKVGFKTKM